MTRPIIQVHFQVPVMPDPGFLERLADFLANDPTGVPPQYIERARVRAAEMRRVLELPLTADTPIEDTPLGAMIIGILKRDNVATVGDLCEYWEYRLLDLRGMGGGMIDEIVALLARHKMGLRPNPIG